MASIPTQEEVLAATQEDVAGEGSIIPPAPGVALGAGAE